MYFTNKQLSDAIVSALKNVEIRFYDNKWLVVGLPQLGRSDYTTFKKILSEIYGKWNKKLDAHTFDNDPTTLIQEIVSVRCLPERKPHDAFFTPRAVTKDLLDWGDFWFFDADKWSDNYEFHKYLEPQAGQGNMVEVLKDLYQEIPQIDCCEIDEFSRDVLKRKGFNVIGENFLDLQPNPIYRWVIMNPPFNGKCGDYVDHIQHAFKFLNERGRLLAIVPESFLNSKIKRIVDFRNWVFTYGSHARLPEKAFAESGTTIPCVMLRIDNHSDERIKLFETLKWLYDTYDKYTGSIVVALKSNSLWCDQVRVLTDRVTQKTITSKETLLKEIVRLADSIVNELIYKDECDFRWDTFTKSRFAEHCYQDTVEDYFDGRSPFEEAVAPKAVEPKIEYATGIQLSLFS